ncbi:hypothetical protein MtrunA17_Chr8g0384691 [Medicago truncatula]|uniref:DUF3727 family protein n=1 Tax=Medicago truncatula TaxID=3880 RepID=G7LEY0_MEDTR|nr:uncharacterized protein LOC11435722 [Medicago truncatula]AET04790.1 DUF3727 family protein [Medicago truncatula]RHN43152.1 hypothetical protein MtrunA17_Chr8g0384691 [Medicago truncatula]
MALRCSSAAAVAIFKSCVSLKSHIFPPISLSFQNLNSHSNSSTIFCTATKSQKNSPSSSKKKTKKKKNTSVESDDWKNLNSNTDFELLRDFSVDNDVQNVVPGVSSGSSLFYPADMPLPEPPTGFAIDENGELLLTSANRLITIVDPMNNLPLDCVVRRTFKSSDRDECMLLCPVDTPVQILKNTPDGWSAIRDEEVESILPAAAYALAKIHMHLVYSGYCYTARGGFCYTEQDILDFHTDDGTEVDGLPSDGVEITYFDLEDTRYMIYTPSEPLQFVVVKGENGMFQMADDDLLDDPAVIDAIDEETEFNALVEEEAALIEAMMDESNDDE